MQKPGAGASKLPRATAACWTLRPRRARHAILATQSRRTVTSYSARFESDVPRLLAWLAAWTSIGLFYLSQDVARRYFFGDPKPWREATYWIVRASVLALFTPAILWLGRRWPIERPHRLIRSLQ